MYSRAISGAMLSKRAARSHEITGVAPATEAARSHAAALRSNSAANELGSPFTLASTSGARAKITTARDMRGSLLECRRMRLHVTSEIGKLKSVLVHLPGRE